MSDLDRLSRRVASLESELRSVQGELARLQRESQTASSGAAAGAPPSPAPSAAVGAAPARGPSAWQRFQQHFGSGDLEFLLGGNILGKLGLLALVLAAGWFIKYAFDNHWINESGRIYTGLIVGFGIVVAGLRLSSRKFYLLGPAVTGAGFAVLYIAFFGAFYFYDLVGRTEAFLGLFLLSAALAYLAARADNRLLYSFSLLGAFLAPILLSSGENSYRFLFAYCMVVNAGFLAVSFVRAWRVVPLLLLGANATLFFVWFVQNGTRSSFPIPYAHVLFLHAVFLVREFFLFPRVRREVFWDNHLTMGLSHAFFFVASLLLARQYHADWSGHLLLVGAFSQLVAAVLLPRYTKPALPASSFEVSWSLALLAYVVWVFGAVTDYFDGRLLTMGWVALAGGLSFVGAQLRAPRIVLVSIPIWLVALFRLFFLEGSPLPFTLILNERFALFLLAGTALAATYWAQRAVPLSRWMMTFAYVSIAVFVIGSLKENADFVHDPHYRNLGYSYVMAAYALVLLVPGFRFGRRSARWSGIVLALLVVIKLYLYDVWSLSLLVRIISFASLGVALVVVSYYYQRFRETLVAKGEKV